MDVIAELLPSVNLVKSEKATKDRQHSKNRYKQMKATYLNTEDDNRIVVGTVSETWNEIERRMGGDRREDERCRGRWLESRAEKDRRQLSKAIFVKI